jgi:hypothetical protein
VFHVERPFVLRQSRPWDGGQQTEVVAVGTGVDLGDGTARVTPAVTGVETTVPLADLRSLLTAVPGGFTTELVYADAQG